MANYEIVVKIEIKASEKNASEKLEVQEDGSYQMVVKEGIASSIDDCEQAVLNVNYPAIREALSKHLSNVSKKKRKRLEM